MFASGRYRGRIACFSLEASPHAVNLTVQGVIIQLLDPSPGQYDDIHRGQAVLLKTRGFPDQSLDAVAINGTANVFLAHDQSETRMAQLIGCGQGHQSFAMNLVNRLVENVSILPGIQ